MKDLDLMTDAGEPHPSDKELDSAPVLDLSSLENPDAVTPSSEYPNAPSENATGEVLFHETVALMKAGELDTADGIKLIIKAASDGYLFAWIYLGEFYADPAKSLYNPALTFSYYEKAAKAEDGEGCYRLGLCYHNGFGCEQDDSAAVNILLKGAAAGHTECICALGICREFGYGCEINYEMAAGLYNRASREGSAVAANNLGGCYYYGHGVPRDKERAVELYRLAAERGNSNAECRLGILCEEGDGCDIDLKAAFDHYQKAAHAKNPTGIYRLALCYDKGIGVEQNYTEAFFYYEMAGSLGNAQAMYEAGMMCLLGRGSKKDPSAAYKKLSFAAEAGIAAAEYEIGNCLFDGIGTVRNREGAYNHYLRAYEIAHDPRAILKLGLCKLKGLGTEKNPESAYGWFCRGASLASRGATYMQGECLFYGVGIAEDKEAAAVCFEKAVSYEYTEEERMVPPLLALAKCAEEGSGIPQDPARAILLYQKAAEYADSQALYHAGCSIIANSRARADFATARDYILRAARKNHLPAMLLMGKFADEGRGSSKKAEDAMHWYLSAINTEIEEHMPIFEFPNRFEEARKSAISAKTEARYRIGMLTAQLQQTPKGYIHAYENIALSASMGFEPAQYEIAKIYLSGGDLEKYYSSVFADREEPVEAGGRLPDKVNTAAAMNKLGDTFFDGRNLQKNRVAAAMCYKTAAEMGNNDAAYSYGWCLRHGEGVRENDAEAIKWLKLSADRGNHNAAYSYGLCCEEGAGTGLKNRREAMTYYRKAAAAGHQNAAKRYIMLSGNEE